MDDSYASVLVGTDGSTSSCEERRWAAGELIVPTTDGR
jgi:hypothetical protein